MIEHLVLRSQVEKKEGKRQGRKVCAACTKLTASHCVLKGNKPRLCLRRERGNSREKAPLA